MCRNALTISTRFEAARWFERQVVWAVEASIALVIVKEHMHAGSNLSDGIKIPFCRSVRENPDNPSKTGPGR